LVCIKAVAFDLDGTLIRAAVDFKRMKNRIIELFGVLGLDQHLFSTSELTYTIIERGLELLLSKGVPDAYLKKIRMDITKIMNQVELESIPMVKAMPGVSEVISELRNRGIKIGVITRGCREYTQAALEKVGISEMIDVISARDDVDRPKPDPSHLVELSRRLGASLEEIILVGDHRTDYMCAQAVHVMFVGVSSDSSDLAELVRADPKAEVIDTLDDLPQLLLRISRDA